MPWTSGFRPRYDHDMSLGEDIRRRMLVRRRQVAAERANHAREVISRVAPLFRRYGTRRVYLFGSLAKDESSPGADIDLAVQGVPPGLFFRLLGDLMMESSIPVDVIDFDDCEPFIRKRILLEGEVVYESGE